MANPSVSIPDELLEEIDDRRGNVPRSRWLQEAARRRIEEEDADEWGDSGEIDAPADD